jgi:hypothetical protein
MFLKPQFRRSIQSMNSNIASRSEKRGFGLACPAAPVVERDPSKALGCDCTQSFFHPAKVKAKGPQSMPQVSLQKEKGQEKVGLGHQQ